MNKKNISLNQSSFNKISISGIYENYKKLLINNLGFNNLSQTNLKKPKIEFKTNNNANHVNHSKYTKSMSNLKMKAKRKIKTSLLNTFNSNKTQCNASSTTKNMNSQSLYTTNENINAISELKILSESLSKKALKKNILYRNNKSCANLVRVKPFININTMTVNSSLNKKNNIIKEGKYNYINSNNLTTAQNTQKTNKNSNSYYDLLSNEITPIIEPIKKISKKKMNKNINTASTPNLFTKVNKPIIKDKEKTYKIFNNRGFFNKNLYNYNNNKYKPVIKTSNNSKNKSTKKIRLIDISKEYLNNSKNINNINNKSNKTYANDNVNDGNKKKKLSTILQSDTVNISKNHDNKTSVITESKNSEDTKKESKLDLHKIFNDKIITNLNNKNIYNIISNNMQLNKNNKNIRNQNNNDNNNNINKQDTINMNSEEEQEKNNNKEHEIYSHGNNYNSTKKLSNSNMETIARNDLYNILKRNSNYANPINPINNNNIKNNIVKEENRKGNQNLNIDLNKNPINFSDIQENININYDISEEQNKDSSTKTNNNMINNKYYNLNKINELNKQEEQELQTSQDKNNEQTQTTIERNNILSKFIKQPIYNISPRFCSCEKHLMAKYSLKGKSYMFIDDVEQKNKNIPILDLKKILKLNDKCIFKLVSFTYDNYYSIMSSSKLLKVKVDNSLKNIFRPIIDDFQNKYKDFIKVINYSFQHKSFTNNHKNNNLFNLIIRCQIITKEVNKSYEIGCNYIADDKNFDYLWKFDVHKKNNIRLWLCTELDKIYNSYKKFTYTSQVSSFAYQDEIELEFNIFRKGNNLNMNSIEWTEPIITNIEVGIFENTNFISSIKYDQLRACEVETQVLFWKNSLPEDDDGIVNNFKKIYGKNFEIKEILFDISKFYFFKFETVAKKAGLIKQNIFSTFDINVVDYESHIKNEIQCIYLINSNYYNKIMDIRLGTKVTFYIIDMKR